MGNTSSNGLEEGIITNLEEPTKIKKGSGCFGPFIVIFIAIVALSIII